MKKYILVSLFLLLPFFAKAELFGFLDGKLYSEDGSLKYICFMNGDCIDKDNNQTTRVALGFDPVEIPVINPIQSITPIQPTTPNIPPVIPEISNIPSPQPNPVAPPTTTPILIKNLICGIGSVPTNCTNNYDYPVYIKSVSFWASSLSPTVFYIKDSSNFPLFSQIVNNGYGETINYNFNPSIQLYPTKTQQLFNITHGASNFYDLGNIKIQYEVNGEIKELQIN